MIRVCQLEYFNDGRVDHVAFLDTVTDTFVTINGEQIWETKDALVESAASDGSVELEFLERLLGLCPFWFLANHEAWRMG